MLINGQWHLDGDGILRPVIQGAIQIADGSWEPISFLVDTGADRTALTAMVLNTLGPNVSTQSELTGVGGRASSVLVETQISLPTENGPAAVFKGHFAAFTDPEALDMSVLGRDITNLFALIVDRPGDIVCLLGQRHRYRIEEG